MKRLACVLCILASVVGFEVSQEGQAPAGQAPAVQRDPLAEERLRLAISSLDYPVTPGDDYRLTYRQTTDILITRDIRVEADSMIDLGIFGKVNAYGLSFIDLKQRVEALIQSGYTRSMPSLSITAPGVFRVAVRGALRQSRFVTVWGLSRLSEVVLSVREDYSSLRSVEVVSAMGVHNRYDLLRAMRLGVADQDPCIRPGDSIILGRTGRTVTLSGEVRQPGEYELLEGEGIRDLVEGFGQGLGMQADPDRIRIDRNSASQGRSEYYSLSNAIATDAALESGDAVVVLSRSARRPVVWFIGAVWLPPEGESPTRVAQDTTDATGQGGQAERPGGNDNRFAWYIHEGECLSDVLREMANYLLPAADLRAAALYREGSAVPVSIDITALLSGSNPAMDMQLSANDMIYIPEIRSTVSVAGAVINPGEYPFRPGAPASYYVSLAGGFDPERNSGGVCRVYGQSGKARPAKEPIRAGDQVFAPSNSLGYQMERNAPLLVTIATVLINVTTLYFTLNGR